MCINVIWWKLRRDYNIKLQLIYLYITIPNVTENTHNTSTKLCTHPERKRRFMSVNSTRIRTCRTQNILIYFYKLLQWKKKKENGKYPRETHRKSKKINLRLAYKRKIKIFNPWNCFTGNLFWFFKNNVVKIFVGDERQNFRLFYFLLLFKLIFV